MPLLLGLYTQKSYVLEPTVEKIVSIFTESVENERRADVLVVNESSSEQATKASSIEKIKRVRLIIHR